MQCIINYQILKQGLWTHVLNEDTQGVRIFHLILFCELNFVRNTKLLIDVQRQEEKMMSWRCSMIIAFTLICPHLQKVILPITESHAPTIQWLKLTVRASNNLPLCFCGKTIRFTRAFHGIKEVHTLASFSNWWIHEKVGCKGANLSILEVSIKMPYEFNGWVAVRLSLITLLSDYPLGAIPQGNCINFRIHHH